MADETAVLDVDESVSHSDTSISDSLAQTNDDAPQQADLGQLLDAEQSADQPNQQNASGFDAAMANAAGQQAAPTDLRGILATRGFKLDGVADAQLADYVTQVAQQAQQAAQYQQQLARYQQQLAEANQYAQYGRQIAPHYEQFQQFLASQNKPQASVQQQVAAKPNDLPPKPDFDPALMQLVTFDEQTGRYVPINQHVMPDVAQKVNAYHDWKAKFAEHLVESYVPPEQLREQFMQEARQAFQQELVAFQQQQAQQQFVNQELSQIGQAIYQRDANGNVVVNPQTGRPELNDYGYRYAGHVQYAEQALGIRDVREQAQYAREKLELEQYRLAAAQQQTAQAQQSAQQAPDPKQQFVQRNNPQRRPNQTASLSRADKSPSVAQNPLLTLDQMIDAEAARVGIGSRN